MLVLQKMGGYVLVERLVHKKNIIYLFLLLPTPKESQMGNYANFEPDFIIRTIALIEQYDEFITDVRFEEQYNYTLIINCFLGLVVMPKERIVNNIPAEPLSNQFKVKLGLDNAELHNSITDLKKLILQLRNSVAHFNIEIISADQQFQVDYLLFKHRNNSIVAKIPASEMKKFLKTYSGILLNNIK
ncbi:HEPN family nuclease [Shewanella ulleungensis]|uniref:pEK499-p136 HEPN domain-containing protein n=1 Tax=Shewanella ulleungensis TaxID=2282699 RepID=A0ABQ2QH47_9GAMM|nr:HEPN family nuclease [Shewanella ulleungensis]MCL1149405.1 hypothetical protein [Shewanella ulleungensis]GGP78936.1 hypothetical protein GCM10009410_09050 [Shewanella ulleungensis]